MEVDAIIYISYAFLGKWKEIHTTEKDFVCASNINTNYIFNAMRSQEINWTDSRIHFQFQITDFLFGHFGEVLLN